MRPRPRGASMHELATNTVKPKPGCPQFGHNSAICNVMGSPTETLAPSSRRQGYVGPSRDGEPGNMGRMVGHMSAGQSPLFLCRPFAAAVSGFESHHFPNGPQPPNQSATFSFRLVIRCPDLARVCFPPRSPLRATSCRCQLLGLPVLICGPMVAAELSTSPL